MIDKEYADKNVKVMFNFTIHQLRILLRGNQWLLEAIGIYGQDKFKEKESDVEELNKLLESIVPKDPEVNQKFLEDMADQQVNHMYD